jgi:hypothetical protein
MLMSRTCLGFKSAPSNHLSPILALLGATVLSALAAQPLSLHPSNPHYFLFRGKPTILITSGEHYGAVLNRDFDYLPYLKELHSNGLNHTRTFSGTYREVPSSFGITENTLAPKPNRYAAPWARSTVPGYFDGGAKFDLSRWDEAYFRRLRDFVAEAAKRAIVVEVNLFCPLYDEELWQANPLNERNNINGVGTCTRNEVYTLAHEDVTSAQKAVARKIVTALQEFDNIYFEVCNEPWCGGVTTAWQNEIISTIVNTEASLTNHHLISLNCSKLKITEPNPAVSIFNFHYAAPADVMALNYTLGKALGDNETGFRGKENFAYRTEAWDCILSGGALFSSLDYSFTASHPDGSLLDYQSPGGGNAVFRRQLGILKDFIHELEFIRMMPDDSVIKAGIPRGFMSARVLAEKGRAYAIYLRQRTDADKVSVRWTGSLASSQNEARTLHLLSSQGVRLWVNDQLVIENPRSHENAEDRCQVAFQGNGETHLRLETYQAKAGSVLKLLWSSPTLKKEVIPSSCLALPDGSGPGLKGEYFEDRAFTKFILSRNNPVIDFDWGRTDPLGQNKADAALSLTLNLPAHHYRILWVDPRTATVIKAENVRHPGGDVVLAVPVFSEDLALKLLAQD